jgi:DinB superfamily
MTGSVELLAAEMDEAYADMRSRLDGLGEDEFFWEPVPEPWTVFRDAPGRWTYHYAEPEPVPAPFTTIGWRLVHVALCKVMYHEWAFGARALDFTNVENPGDVTSSIAMLERGQALLSSDLAALADPDLDRMVLTNWGEPWPAWKIFWTMTQHDAHHGAEIGVLRDLYRSMRAGDTA